MRGLDQCLDRWRERHNQRRDRNRRSVVCGRVNGSILVSCAGGVLPQPRFFHAWPAFCLHTVAISGPPHPSFQQLEQADRPSHNMKKCPLAVMEPLSKRHCRFYFSRLQGLPPPPSVGHRKSLALNSSGRINSKCPAPSSPRSATSVRLPPPAFGGFAQSGVVEMSVAIGGGRASMADQASRNVQALAVHDRMRGMGMS